MPGLKHSIEYYSDSRAACFSGSSRVKKKGRKTKTRELLDDEDRAVV